MTTITTTVRTITTDMGKAVDDPPAQVKEEDLQDTIELLHGGAM